MAKPTCSETDCDKPTLCRGLCTTHYHRLNRATKSDRPPVGICRGCGQPVPKGKPGPPKHYCGPDCRPHCEVDGCDKPVRSKGMCSAHAARAAQYDDPLAPKLRQKNVGTCSVERCDRPSRKRGWCGSHYSQWLRTGEVKPFSYTWAEPGSPCVVCGAPVEPGSGRRKHCSNACQVTDSRTRGKRPTESACDFCGKTFDLGRGRTGRLQRTDTKWCPDCGRESPDVQRYRRYGVTREQYEEAQARGCTICGRTDRKLHIDHDHACCPSHGGRGPATCWKCVRGFICGPCNRGLGLFEDDPASLVRAAEYLIEAHTRTRGARPAS